uniref:Secreted protein n=1 Tax=Triticum urartu TaxID=4572 RepID=A0A8R7PLN2_TRIUA
MRHSHRAFCVRCRLLALRRMTVCCFLWRSGQLRPSWRPTCPLRPKSPCPGPARYMVLNIQPRRGGASSPVCAYHPQRQHRMTRRFVDRM